MVGQALEPVVDLVRVRADALEQLQYLDNPVVQTAHGRSELIRNLSDAKQLQGRIIELRDDVSFAWQEASPNHPAVQAAAQRPGNEPTLASIQRALHSGLAEMKVAVAQMTEITIQTQTFLSTEGTSLGSFPALHDYHEASVLEELGRSVVASNKALVELEALVTEARQVNEGLAAQLGLGFTAPTQGFSDPGRGLDPDVGGMGR
jgi:hypothetical protein